MVCNDLAWLSRGLDAGLVGSSFGMAPSAAVLKYGSHIRPGLGHTSLLAASGESRDIVA